MSTNTKSQEQQSQGRYPTDRRATPTLRCDLENWLAAEAEIDQLLAEGKL